MGKVVIAPRAPYRYFVSYRHATGYRSAEPLSMDVPLTTSSAMRAARISIARSIGQPDSSVAILFVMPLPDENMRRQVNVVTPSIGRTVIAMVAPEENNGSDEAPAVVTRVWGEHPEGGWMVNLRVFLDAPTMPLSLTSVRLVDEKPALVSRNVAAPHLAWWPPRV